MATSTATQAELRSVLMGVGTNYPFVSVEIQEFDIISNDLPKLLADGEFQGSPFKGPIYVTLVMNILGTSAANLWANRATLATAWAKASSDLTFELNVPNHGARTLQGRPYKFELPPWDAGQEAALRIFGVRAQFKAGTPTWT